MRLKRYFAGALAAALLLTIYPVQTVLADEEINTEQSEIPDEEKTQEQLEEEAKAKLEAERKAALETPVDTNSLEGWPQGPAVYAHSAIVMDMDSGAILYAKKPDERHFPASITKLLTTLVALENAELTDRVTFSQDSVDILNWDDASIGMRPGEEISMSDALRAVLLASANEVSYAVAESVGTQHLNGGYDTFINLMNERAAELGCTGSNWVNPNGLHDEQHYTTAHDMALITSAVYQEEEFHNIMDILEYRIPPTNLETEERVFQQNHKMLWPENYYYYEYCTGGKTGYTDQSGTTLVTTAEKNGMRLAAVVLYAYGIDAYTDTRAMLDYVFDNFSKISVAELETSEEIKSFADEDAYVVLPANIEFSQLNSEIISQSGDTGKIVYTYQGQEVGSAEVTLARAAQKTEISQVQKEEAETEEEETKSPLKTVLLIAGGAALIFLILFFRAYIRYKKRMQRRRRNAAKRAARQRYMQGRRRR